MYIPHVLTADPIDIVFFEKYQDEKTAETHRQSAYYKAAGKKFKNLLAGPPQVEILTEL